MRARVEKLPGLPAGALAHPNSAPSGASGTGPQRSSWSRAGVPLPFVPYDDDVVITTDPPSYTSFYRHNLQAFADSVPAARIPVERFFGDVLLVAGGDDQVWPALDFAREIEERRAAYGLPTTVVTHQGAGHRVILPREAVATGSTPLARGGTETADRELGRRAWPEILRVLRAP